jgi:hypothetical protein
MAVTITRSAGMLLLSIWLILTGLAGLAAVPVPARSHGNACADCGSVNSGGTLTGAQFARNRWTVIVPCYSPAPRRCEPAGPNSRCE